MLHDLRREDPAQRAVLETVQMLDRPGLLDLQALAAAVGDHVPVDVDPARLHACLAEEPEELAATAADIEHGRGVTKLVDVGPLAVANALRRPAHPALVGEVVGEDDRAPVGAVAGAAAAAAAGARSRRSSLVRRSSSSTTRSSRGPKTASADCCSSQTESRSFNAAALNRRCSAASGSTYQRIDFRRTPLSGVSASPRKRP